MFKQLVLMFMRQNISDTVTCFKKKYSMYCTYVNYSIKEVACSVVTVFGSVASTVIIWL